MSLIKSIPILMLLLTAPTMAFSESNSNSNSNVDAMLLDMESHWKQILAEQNVSKRQRMLKVHANIMMDIESTEKGYSEEKRKSLRHNSSELIEIHHMMMNMMMK